MSLLRIESLYQDKEKRKRSNLRVYETILKQCHRRIQQVNRKLNMTQCYFHIPSYIFGYPAYNVVDINEYLCMRLSKNGLLVYPTTESSIYISWHPLDIDYDRYQKSLYKEETKAALDPLTKSLINGDQEDSDTEEQETKSTKTKATTKTNVETNANSKAKKKTNPKDNAADRPGSIDNPDWDHTHGALHFDNSFDDILPVNTKKIRKNAKPSDFPWF